MEPSVTGIPTVSVVIPYHNDADTIERAVQSVLAQSFTDFELLIVDDGSEDQLIGPIGDSAAHGVRVIRHETNRGAAAARNSGIKQSKGRYVAFLDADDSWRPNKLARQLEALGNAEAGVAACVSGFALHREGTGNVEIHDRALQDSTIEELLWGCPYSPGSTMICDRQCFDTVGLFDEGLRRLEDWDWLLRFAAEYRLVHLSGVWADIYLSAKPPATHLSDVLHAVGLIHDRHLGTASRLGSIRRRIFLSALEVEKAAAHYRSGDKFASILIVLRSLVIWPFRNFRFFRRLVECLPRAPGTR